MPPVYRHFLPAFGIVSGNDTGADKEENPIYKLYKFACLWGVDHASLRTTHFQSSAFLIGGGVVCNGPARVSNNELCGHPVQVTI
jgi:hypothetical protein